MLQNDIEKGINCLLNGDVIGLPTETVYGLAGIAHSDDAVRKIFALKKRPPSNPLIVHISSLSMARTIAHFNDDAYAMAYRHWPGPVTFILPIVDGACIASLATAGLSTIALRMPSNLIALEIIEKVGPVAAPSANISGGVTCTSADSVKEVFPDLFVIDGGRSRLGIESSIINLTDRPMILRYGSANIDFEYCIDDSKAQSPGRMFKHYSPVAMVVMNSLEAPTKEDGVLDFGGQNISSGYYMDLSVTGDLQEAAYNLFFMLRALDKLNVSRILIAPIPDHDIGKAINDRLYRSAKQ